MLLPIKFIRRERLQNNETRPLPFSVRIVGSGEHKTVIFCNAVFRRSVEPLVSPRLIDMQSTSYIERRSAMWRDLPIDLISRSPIARWAPIPLRLIVGYGFMEHGFAKLARGLDAFPAILQALGVPAPHLMGWLTILVEIFGGLAVLLNALVPLASIPMAAVLLVAMFTVHLPYGFPSIKLQAVTAAGAQFGPPGYETDLLYLACLAALVLGGSGPFAIDGLLAKRNKV